MLYYTDITQNTYIQSWTVWDIMAIENCGLPCGPRTIAVSWDSYLLIGLLAEQWGRRVTSPLYIPVWCILLRNVSISMTRMRGTLQLQFMTLCHSQVTLMKSTGINITETTYSCQFQYEFGNQEVCNSCQSFKIHWPLSPKPFNLEYRCFGVFRYSLT